jgi:hypothetical protein
MSHSSVLTSFSVETDTGIVEVPFRIQAEGNSVTYRDWTIKPVLVQTHIPGTNETVVEHLGFHPAVVAWTLRFASTAEYEQLLELSMRMGTLRVLAGLQSLKGSAVTDHLLGRDYELLDEVLLLDIDDTPHLIGGQVTARVTFQRAVDPVTRLAVVS